MLERFLDCLGSIDYDFGQLDLDEMRRCASAGSDRELIEYYCIVIDCLHLEVPSKLRLLTDIFSDLQSVLESEMLSRYARSVLGEPPVLDGLAVLSSDDVSPDVVPVER